MFRRAAFLLLSLSLLSFSASTHAQIRYRKLPLDTISARLSSSPLKDQEREAKLRDLFAEAGCNQITETPVKGQKLPNLECVLPGTSPKRIIVGAHFDHAEVGSGIVDNWSGASLLPSILQSISAEPRIHTIVFVAFAAEEKGLVGSKFYVKSLSRDELAAISAMVNLDTLGLSSTKVWISHADPGLATALGQTARATNLPVAIMNVDGAGSADSEPFREKKVPAITIHSVTPETWSVLHSQNDKIDAIKMSDYYDTYQLVSAYVAMLDRALDKPAAAASPAPQAPKTQ